MIEGLGLLVTPVVPFCTVFDSRFSFNKEAKTFNQGTLMIIWPVFGSRFPCKVTQNPKKGTLITTSSWATKEIGLERVLRQSKGNLAASNGVHCQDPQTVKKQNPEALNHKALNPQP